MLLVLALAFLCPPPAAALSARGVSRAAAAAARAASPGGRRAAAGAGPQLSLVACNETRAPTDLVWAFSGSASTPGAFSLKSSAGALCATYDVPTTNLVVSACAAAGEPLQTFVPRADGTIYSPSQGLCVDSQYYGNVSGSVLGLYECFAPQEWDLFTFSAATGLITNVQNGNTLCVNGGGAPPPAPTPEQLSWMDQEVALMISYDMITQLTEVPNPQHFCIQAGGDSGFPVPPATRFDPSNATRFTDSWMAAARAAGAGYTLLVASHCSGFLQWQSDVKLPDGSPYPYTVAQSYWRGGKGDVVADYVASSNDVGLGYGFYLTWNYNYLFNWGPSGFAKTPLTQGQINVTEAEYRAMMTASIAEVWGRYPKSITEIWFDGGEDNIPLNALIAELQPGAVQADGSQPPNVARLVGEESGYAPDPTWCTTNAAAQDGSGDPAGSVFCPAEADTPIALNDAWFWKPAQQYRSLAELKGVYRNTVGANALLELGVLPDNTGSIPADQMAVLQAFGDYARECHGAAAALARVNGTGMSISVSFPFANVNRVILQEDLSFGQLVQGFTVEVLPAGGYSPKAVPVAVGSSIGHKRILYFASGAIYAQRVTVTATLLHPGADAAVGAYWRNVAVYAPCAGDE